MDTGNSLKVGARLCFGLSQGKLQHSPWPWKTLEIPHTCQKFIPFMLCQPSFGLFSAQVTVSRAIVLWQRLPAMARANLIRTYRFDTLPKRNIAPEKCRLEGEISFWEGCCVSVRLYLLWIVIIIATQIPSALCTQAMTCSGNGGNGFAFLQKKM